MGNEKIVKEVAGCFSDFVLSTLSSLCLTTSLFIFFGYYKEIGTEPAWYFLALAFYFMCAERMRVK